MTGVLTAPEPELITSHAPADWLTARLFVVDVGVGFAAAMHLTSVLAKAQLTEITVLGVAGDLRRDLYRAQLDARCDTAGFVDPRVEIVSDEAAAAEVVSSQPPGVVIVGRERRAKRQLGRLGAAALDAGHRLVVVGERARGAVQPKTPTMLWHVSGHEDPSELAAEALAWSRAFDLGHRLVMVACDGTREAGLDRGRLRALMNSQLATLGRAISTGGVEVEWEDLLAPRVDACVARHAATVSASLVVAAITRPSRGRWQLSSNARAVVAESPVPVMLTPTRPTETAPLPTATRPPLRRRVVDWSVRPVVWATALLVAVAGVGMGTVELGYVAEVPGPASAAGPLLVVDGPTPPAGSGALLLVTVERRQLTGFGVVRSWFDPNADVHSLSGHTRREGLDAEQMRTSQRVATRLAFEVLDRRGIDVGFGTGDLRIDAGTVTGPSGGLAFTLTVLDRLTSGDLTGGHVVGVTGTIDEHGRVGPVVGVRQKMASARRAGADSMIVPRSSEFEALSHAGGLRVLAVDDLDGALDALEALGGDPLR